MPYDAHAALKDLRKESQDAVICHRCGFLHFSPDSPCPECRASVFYQCSTTPGGCRALSHRSLADHYQREGARLQRRLLVLKERHEAHQKAWEEGLRARGLDPTNKETSDAVLAP